MRRRSRLPLPRIWGPLALALAALACRERGAGEALDADAVRRGAAVYRAHCASCHGARGEGAPDWKQPDAQGYYPAPPHDSTGHTWHHADGLLHRIVATGGTDPTSRRPSRMPAFGDTLSAREIRDVVTYLKTLWTPAQRRRQGEVSRDDPFPAPPPGPGSAGRPAGGVRMARLAGEPSAWGVWYVLGNAAEVSATLRVWTRAAAPADSTRGP